MWFDTWALDSTGNTIPSSKNVSTRSVILTGQSFQDRLNVVIMVDSIAVPGQALRLDTLYLSQTLGGDLWAYGLLSSLGARYIAGTAGPEWNMIVPLSGNTTSWTVGFADTTETVLGSIAMESNYFSVDFGGTNFLLQTQRIDISNFSFSYTFWFSLTPPVFAAIYEPTAPMKNGLYRVLTAAKVAGS